MKLSDIIISKHIIKDRADRIAEINATGGIGTLLIALPSRQEEHIVHLMTTTEVILVVDKYTSTCLTLYRANDKQKHAFIKYGTKLNNNEYLPA